jgi:hypothetical protein
MRPGLAAAAVSAVLVLSACSDNHAAGPTSSTDLGDTVASPPSSTDIAPSTATSPAPVMPEMPAAARQKTTAGAKAFVRYYIDVLNYSHASQLTMLLRSLAANPCQVCEILSDAIDEMHRRGGFQHGGFWDVEDVSALPTSKLQHQNLLVNIRVEPGDVKRFRRDTLHHVREDRLTYIAELAWQRRSWRFLDVASP